MTTELSPSIDVHSKKRSVWMLVGQALLAFAIPALMVLCVQLARGGIMGVDGYYHIRMTEMYGRGLIQAVGGDFHWTQHSIWNGGFSDKDWLWHILFVPLTWIWGSTSEGLQGCAQAATCFGTGMIGLALWRVMRDRKIPFALIWTIFAVSASETIVYRLCLPRSYLLSVMFVLIGANLIWRRAGIALAATAMLYTLAYTAPHVLIVVTCAAAGIRFLWPEEENTRKREILLGLKTMGWVIAGIVVGVILHPESLNQVKHWTVQNVMVPLYAMKQNGFADSIGGMIGIDMPANFKSMDLDIGGEMSATDGRVLLNNHLMAIALFFGAWVTASMTRVRARREDLFWYGLASMFGVMMLASQRFMEYFLPVCTVAGAGLISHSMRDPKVVEYFSGRSRVMKYGAILFFLAVASHGVLRASNLYNITKDRAMRAWQPVTEAMKRHIPAGEGVYHPTWDAFTQLFYYAPEYNYVAGLDPTFLYLRSPDLYESYAAIRRGDSRTIDGDKLTPDRLMREQFGMKWFVMLNDGKNKLATEMQHAEVAGRITLVERGKDDEWRVYFLEKK